MDEKIFYNAVALAARGNYEKIEAWRRRHGTWKETYGALGLLLPNPQKEWARLEKLGIQLILFSDAEYPPLLREIPHPPFGIYVFGSSPLLSCSLALAIVGTRRATPDGKNIARQFGRELAGVGFTIVSGLAFGVDAAAHEGCLESAGTAIAVLAGGLDDISPHSNEPLAQKILTGGEAIVSEYPIGETPRKGRFIERNRIVSGLARGALIIEAPERSGSLATARFAFEQNHDLFVVPGSTTHPNFAASHELIRQGATLVTKPEHIMEAYGMETGKRRETRNKRQDLSPEESLILEILQGLDDAAEVDKLADIARLEPQAVNQAITFLIIKHLVKEVAGGYIIG